MGSGLAFNWKDSINFFFFFYASSLWFRFSTVFGDRVEANGRRRR